MRCLSVLAGFFVLAAVALPAMALDPIPQQPGFSGYVRPGIGGLYIKDNMVAKVLSFDLSDKRISDLGDDPNSETSVLVTVPFNLAYTFAGSRTQIFLGTDVGDLLSFDTAQQLGIKQEIGSAGLFQAGVLFSGNVRVWKDPYVTGQNRDDTSRRNVGFQVGWDKIFGSNLELEYSIRSVDIGHEKSGQFLGLSDPQQDRLDRNGTVHQLVAGYSFKFGGTQTLRPEISVFREDLEGEAMANTGIDLKLTYIYDRDPFTFILNGYIGAADYDKSNPIYGKTQEDTRFGSAASLYYTNPWGWTLFGSEPMRFFGTVGYFGTDSNIDFYNQEAALVMGGIAFRWR
jgi:hypothetical protein